MLDKYIELLPEENRAEYKQAELAKMKLDALLKDRRAVAMQELTKIGLPVDLADLEGFNVRQIHRTSA